MMAPSAAVPSILLRRRDALPIVTPNPATGGRRKRLAIVLVVVVTAPVVVVAFFHRCRLHQGRHFATLFGRLQAGVKGLVRIPSFATVGRVIVADLGASRGIIRRRVFSRTIQVVAVDFSQIAVGHVERILGGRRPAG